MEILNIIEVEIDMVVIGGYVDLGDKPELALAQILKALCYLHRAEPIGFTSNPRVTFNKKGNIIFVLKRFGNVFRKV